jgi:hypothetical protein
LFCSSFAKGVVLFSSLTSFLFVCLFVVSSSPQTIISGMSKAQWQKLKEAERKKNQGKNLGQVGITTFKSQSFADWQKKGGKNLFPVDPKKVKDPSQIPYM